MSRRVEKGTSAKCNERHPISSDNHDARCHPAGPQGWKRLDRVPYTDGNSNHGRLDVESYTGAIAHEPPRRQGPSHASPATAVLLTRVSTQNHEPFTRSRWTSSHHKQER